MIAHPFRYERPATISEALSMLQEPGAKVLAGGMSLIPMMKLRLAAPDLLVDLAGVPGGKRLDAVNGHLRLGAMLTHAEVESDPLLRGSCPLLSMCAGRIGDAQVRNAGTLGGSVAHADPAADYPAALLALEAEFVLTSTSGDRTVRADEFFVDTFTTALMPEELITEIRVPRDPAGTGTAYEKKVQPASGFAVVGVGARISVADGRITKARVGVTGLSGKPYRATNVEALLEGASGSSEDIRRAASVVAEGIDANTDIHASAEYRTHLATVFTARAIQSAISRAGGQG